MPKDDVIINEEREKEIFELAKQDFARSFQFSNLFTTDNEDNILLKYANICACIIGLITLIVVIVK